MKCSSPLESGSSPIGRTGTSSSRGAARSRFVPKPRGGIILTRRDEEVIWHCFLLRCLRRDQIERLGFTSLQRCNSRLRLLYDWRYLVRYVPASARYGAQSTYSVGPAGVALVAARAASLGWDLTDEDVRVQARRPAATLLDHAVAIGDVCLAFRESFSEADDCRFQFVPERLVRAEYDIRRVDDGGNRRLRHEVFAPDGCLRVRSGKGHSLCLFLEADCGTMGTKQWAGKLEIFSRFAASAMAAGIYGVDDLATVAVTTGARRARSLCRLAAGHPEVTFLATTYDELRSQGPLAPVWRIPGSDALVGLFEAGRKERRTE